MRVDFATDLTAFAAEALPWLRAEPVYNNVAATVIGGRAEGLVPLEPDARWMRVMDGDRLTGVAAHTPPHPLLLPLLGGEATIALADGLAGVLPLLAGVTGPRDAVDRFTARWSELTGATADLARSSTLFRGTPHLSPRLGVPGHPRPATLADLDWVTDRLAAFHAENRPDLPPTAREARPAADRRRLSREPRPVWVWEHEGEPVSLVVRSVASYGAARITTVYTPPEHRGHGYAGAAVVHLAKVMMNEPGVDVVMLYTASGNVRNNRFYRYLGFEQHGETAGVVEYRYTY